LKLLLNLEKIIM